MPQDHDRAIRDQLLWLLKSGDAHADFEAAIRGIPPKMRWARAKGVPHTLWQLLEHMRLAQWDILEFSRNAKHVSPKWPEGYWPESAVPPSSAAWTKSVKAFRSDLDAMCDLVARSSADLFAPIPHGSGQTILREAMLVADHNAYHLGEIVLLRRALGCWK